MGGPGADSSLVACGTSRRSPPAAAASLPSPPKATKHIHQLVEHVLEIPAAPELLLTILEVVPLQLLAYHIAVRRGCDVDQPRNLAKGVTVE
jgi:glutamine---fructose-6-phosphate transaminase (isomerizing)